MIMNETYYISHGAPTLCIDESLPARAFLKSWKETEMPQKPNSILMVSAHWDTTYPTVSLISNRHPTIHDFYGFPDPMYKIEYPAPGAPELGKRVKELLLGSGLKRVDQDRNRGLDHGAWVPLMLMYPEADVPVCQLSIQSNKDATYHYNLGKALAPLKEEGVLIIGSGSATHNLRALSRSPNAPVAPWAHAFDTWLKDALLEGRYDDVNHYLDKAPHAKMAHPWPDHLYPLHVAIGAAAHNSKAKLIHHSWDLSALSYASYAFSSPTA